MPTAYRAIVDALGSRYLGRELEADEGVSPAAVDEAQRRLGTRIPPALAYYYRRAGRCRELSASHHRLYAPTELRVEGEFLLFMDENQSVVSWGFRASECGEEDPVVWQRNNTPPREWYAEEKTFTAFLTHMFDWYVETGILRR